MVAKIFQSPYLLALLVGLHPALFYINNNWFMFKPSMSLFIVGGLTLSSLLILGSFYFFLDKTTSTFVHAKAREGIVTGVFAALAFLWWAYLLRQTLLTFLPQHPNFLYAILLVLSGLIAWFVRRSHIYQLNIVLCFLCIASLGTGLVSILTTKNDREEILAGRNETKDLYQTLQFTTKPNIYYLVPDAYPNREGLNTIYHYNNSQFYEQLSSLDFSIYHEAYSNYVSTIASIMGTFGMEHHYYNKSIGNNEMLGARELIGGKNNPLTQILTNNGYVIHYIHQTDYLHKMGCFVDECSPSVGVHDLVDFLVPVRVKKKLGLTMDQSIKSFEQRMLAGIDRIAQSQEPHFVYAHVMVPGHSKRKDQTVDSLNDFRKTFITKTQDSNQTLLTLIERIMKKDPQAMIIINSDHGGFGLGWYGIAPNAVFEGLAKRVTALDHVGVLLAIRWPNDISKPSEPITTNINLFRHIFASLSGENKILSTSVPDDSYLKMGSEKIFTVVQNGKLLDNPYPLSANN